MKEEDIRFIIEKVVQQMERDKEKMQSFGKIADKSGVMCIKTATVIPEPFDTGVPDNQVKLTDIVTLKESPRIGAGVMEMTKSEFAWTLKYDEFDYIIDGSLSIKIGDNIITGEKGDILYIPKGSAIHFSVPEFARFVYFTYPADWQEQE